MDPDSLPTIDHAMAIDKLNAQNKLAVEQINLIVVADKKQYQVYSKYRDNANLPSLEYNLAVSILIAGELIQADFESGNAFYIPMSLKYVRNINMNNLKWEITEEEKYYKGIRVIKAKAKFENSDLEYSQLIPITCWFAPSIPLAGGPTAYANLPGLILELETDRIKYKLENFELGKFEFKNFNPNNLEVKSHQEFIQYYDAKKPIRG